MKRVILGTAGHIDHGKSSLVKALTGVDPDRLKEEKERGITIDLGFANIVYDDLIVGIIDVPGHERLIKNMLAGVGGIDIVMLVVAADEGVMPQTKEHLAICNLLKIKSGLVALNKADLVDEETLELAKEDILETLKGTFLEGAEIIPVSAKTGLNIETLKKKIRDLGLRVEEKSSSGIFRMPIDRVFTLKGFGTIVTGTVLSGRITIDSAVEILPSGISSRVRGLQSHGQSVKEAVAGQRVGINLQGISKEELKRGDVVTEPRRLRATDNIEVKIELLKDAVSLRDNSPVHFYLTTSETVGRIRLIDRKELLPGQKAYAHIRLEEPVVAMARDRFIIRRFSPLETLGGGVILDTDPPRRKRDIVIEQLDILAEGELSSVLEVKINRRGLRGMSVPEIESWINSPKEDIDRALSKILGMKRVVKADTHLFHREHFEKFKAQLVELLKQFHQENPLKDGISKEELKLKVGIDKYPEAFNLVSLIEEVSLDGNTVRLKSVSRESVEKTVETKIIEELKRGEFQPPWKEELAERLKIQENRLSDILKILSKEGKVVRINDSLYLTKENYQRMIENLKDFFSKKQELTVSEFRTLLGTTRKYALAYLEHLDSNRITLRVGETRRLIKRS